MKFLLPLLLCASFALAEKPAFEFKTFTKFSSAELFGHLDKVGNNGNWMEYDKGAIEDPSVKAILKENPSYKAAWGIAEKGNSTRFAVLVAKENMEFLRVYNLKSFDAKPFALTVNEKVYPENVLADYRGVAQNEFVHLDNPALKLKISNRGMKFTYEKPDANPLRFDENFRTRAPEEKQEIISEYVAFFKYEYALMLRAFVQSTRGIFNWQPWHWYMPEWYERYFISNEEISAMLSSYSRPAMFTIFKAKTSRNVLVEMRTDGNGRYEMIVDNQ